MKVPFSCAFIAFLASYDNVNLSSYLLIFFPARYKACRICRGSDNFPAKIISVKITQNKVCTVYARSYVCIGESEVIFSLWVLVFRKKRQWLILLVLIALLSLAPHLKVY